MESLLLMQIKIHTIKRKSPHFFPHPNRWMNATRRERERDMEKYSSDFDISVNMLEYSYLFFCFMKMFAFFHRANYYHPFRFGCLYFAYVGHGRECKDTQWKTTRTERDRQWDARKASKNGYNCVCVSMCVSPGTAKYTRITERTALMIIELFRAWYRWNAICLHSLRHPKCIACINIVVEWHPT